MPIDSLSRTAFVFIAGLGLAACGGAAETGAGPASPDDGASALPARGAGGGTGRGGRQHRHTGLSPEVDAYHDVMAPLWHAQPGAQRTQDTCARSGELVERARAITAAPAPEAAAAQAGQWRQSADALVAASEALAADCAAGAAGFEDQFRTAHDAFHRLIRILGAR